MTEPDDDRDLRERFASLRRDEETQAPALQRLVATATTRRVGRRRWALAPVLAVVTVLAALGVIIGQALNPQRPVSRAPAVSLAAWTEPTAFLLRTPGRDLLSTVPAFARDMPAIDPEALPGVPAPSRSPAKRQRSSST